MSSAAKRSGKKVRSKKFPDEMYNTLLGSFLISLYILRSTTLEPKDLAKVYKIEKKKWLKNKVTEDKWMDEALETISKLNSESITTIPYGKIALVTSDWNMLIVPYLDLGKGPQTLPIREDGFRGPTLLKGKVYPIVETVTNNEEG